MNGFIGGRVDYSVGATAGNSVDTRSTENFYGRLGFKLGGMRLDGEGASPVPNAMRPWEELAVTVDGFVYRSVNSANFANPDPAVTVPVLRLDPAIVVGGNLRVQLNSLELNGGGHLETHWHRLGGAPQHQAPALRRPRVGERAATRRLGRSGRHRGPRADFDEDLRRLGARGADARRCLRLLIAARRLLSPS